MFGRDGMRGGVDAGGGLVAERDARQHAADDRSERDWKRTTLIVGLGTLSWVATYVGMLELIEANIGSLPLSYRAIIGFSVAMLMVMIIWLLDQIFRPQLLLSRLFYITGYLFLTLISVGFGFGFYWKVFESRSEASRSAEAAVSQVQTSLTGASARLIQLESTLSQLAAVSVEKAELERTKGTSCPNSRPGDGPRRRMRDADAQKFAFASELVGNRATSVRAGLTNLDGDLAKIASNDPSTIDSKTGTRNAFMRELARKLDMTTANFNSLKSDPQLQQLRSELSERSTQTAFPDGRGGTVSCPDAQLQSALRGAVAAIDQLPELQPPQIAVVEGSEATIEAFRRLSATLGGLLTFDLPPSADELRALQKKAIERLENGAPMPPELRQVGEGGLASRDYIPLGVAIFVDFCLFLVSLVQRPAGRLSGLMPKMQAAERGPVIDILSRFNDIHRDQQVRENFEIFRHVVFDMNGDYYAAIPLDAPTRLNPSHRETLRVEAQLLANLFASFEKEKIFKRTLLPTTASIQKRLRRQGSKFAESEAFRVYKFADGAWSDIILGAVMGAARRIDGARAAASRSSPLHDAIPHDELTKTLSTYDNTTGSARPIFDAPGTMTDAASEQAAQRDHSEAAVMTARGPRAKRERPAPRTPGNPGAADPRATPRDDNDDHGLVLPFGETATSASPPAAGLDPVHETRFGPYARQYQPAVEPYGNAPQSPRVIKRPRPVIEAEADVDVRAAARTHRDMEADDASSAGHDDHATTRIVRLADTHSPAGQGQRVNATGYEDGRIDEDQVSVTLSRETATFSVPVSEAVLPKSLAAALAAMGNTPRLNHDRTNEAEPSELSSKSIDDDEHLTRDEQILFARLAPPAAE